MIDHHEQRSINGWVYTVVSSVAKMPQSCWGGNRYRHVAVMRSLNGDIPLCIRDAKGARVVARWDRRYDGKTKRCAFDRAVELAIEWICARDRLFVGPAMPRPIAD